MLQGEHSAILLTFIKLPFVIKIVVLSIFEWPFYTGSTVISTKSYVLAEIFPLNIISLPGALFAEGGRIILGFLILFFV